MCLVDDLLGPGSRQQREDAAVRPHARNARCAEHRLGRRVLEHQLNPSVVAAQVVERAAATARPRSMMAT